MANAKLNVKTGDTVVVTLYRGNEEMQVEMTLGERPVE